MMINKGWVSHDDVFNGLDKHPDGTTVIWKGLMYTLLSDIRSDGHKHLGLDGLHSHSCKSKRDIFDKTDKWCVACKKFKEPSRNDKCYCGSGKKYKKCHLNK